MKKNLKKLFSVGLICLSLYAFGQEKPITGKVTDSSGYPVQDAYVYVEGSESGVYTDENGNYTIDAQTGENIVIEFIGFDTKKVKVGKADNYNVKLTSGQNEVNLDDLIVVGYGSARDVASTASNVSVVSGDNIKGRPSANALDALQGQVAGLQIFTSSGEPSASSSIRLHGIGSIGGSTTPLFILDGMQVTSDILSTLNPNDIANVSILKDAAATSIYGSRAANGVVYITTKTGKKGDGVFSVDMQHGYSQLASTEFFDNMMNSKELTDFWVETGFKTRAQVDDILKRFPYDTNWRKVYYRDIAPVTQVNASFSGGSANTTYYISGSYLDQDGLAKRSGIKKYTLRTNIDSKVLSWLKVGANVNLMYNKYNTNPYGRNSTNRGLYLLAQPMYSPVDANGEEYVRIPGWGRLHPNYLASKTPSFSKNIEVNPTGYVELTPTRNLTLRSQGGVQLWVNRVDSHRLPSYVESLNDGSASEDATYNYIKTITNTAEYKFKAGEDNSFILLAGQEFVEGYYDSFGAESSGHTNDNLILLGQGTKNKDVRQSRSDYAYSSFFGRLEYDYGKKYYLNATVRRDGSSRFGINNRFANFWSTGLMWKAKREDFLADVSWLSDLTLKASIGTSGNSSGIGNYTSLELLGFNQYQAQTGYGITNPGNPSLTWEKQTLSSVTANVGLFDRVDLELTYYDRRTKDQLFDVPLPYTSGFDEYSNNVGAIQNKGIDVIVNAGIVKSKDFYLNSYVNFNYNQDKVTELFQGRNYWIIPNTLVGYGVNKPISYLLPIFKGVNENTGKPEWYLPNGENVLDTRKDDQNVTSKFSSTLEQNVGISRYAPINGGFGFSTGYKGFSVNADFSFVIGKYLINNNRFFTENPNVFTGFNQSRTVTDYWKKPGDKAQFPKYTEQFTQLDSRLLEDASFLRLKNISVNYNLPTYVVDKITFLKNVRVYAIGRNLLTLTKFTGPDPEVDSNISMGNNPNTKQYVFGVELKF